MARDNINDTGTNPPVVTTTQSQATYPQNTAYTDPVYKDTASDPAYTALSLALDKKAAAQQDLNKLLNAQSDSGNYDEVARKAAQARLDAADAEVVKRAEASSKSQESDSTPTFTQDQVNKDLTAGNAPTKPGNTTNDDASINNTKSGTNTTFNAATNPSNPITPSPNVLDQFASYTYSLSWYLLTPQQANIMARTSKINTNEWSLLVQSGGAEPPVTPSAPGPAVATPPATQTKPVTATYKPDGTVDAFNAAGYDGG